MINWKICKKIYSWSAECDIKAVTLLFTYIYGKSLNQLHIVWPLLTVEAAFILVSTTNRDLGPGPFSWIKWKVLMSESFS